MPRFVAFSFREFDLETRSFTGTIYGDIQGAKAAGGYQC
jgi:hypothetical protein